MKFYHYSLQSIKELEKRDYQQFISGKPNGLWISVEGFEEDWGWKNWCLASDFDVERLECKHEVFLREDANILYISTLEELKEMGEGYDINWHYYTKKYQGIIIAPYIGEGRYIRWYAGWDCSSGCIWDMTAIQSIKQDENYVPE